MQGLSKQRALRNLRARIAGIEKRPPLADAANDSRKIAPAGFVLPAGILHEMFGDGPRNAGALLGFALAGASAMLAADRPAILYLQLTSETQETGFPYGSGLAAFGIDPQAIVLIRTTTIIELLWAAEEGLACRAVAAVIADVGSDPKALDFTASRRLGMRAAETKTTFLLLRYGLGRTASAARLRWHIAPALSGEVPFDPRAPGETRWHITLEKGLWQGKPNGEWLLSWTRNGFDILASPDTNLAPAATPVPRTLPPALGHRLSQTA